MIKRGEHFFKGLSNPESQISAVPPERYGDRFVRFISGITKTREAAELERAELNAKKSKEDQTATERITGSLDDPRLSGVNMHRTPTDKVMEKAEKQAAKSEQHGADESRVPEKKITTMRSPSAERGDPTGYALPVVEEDVEGGSTGGRSGRSGQSGAGSPLPPAMIQDGDPPPTPPKDSAHADGSSPLKTAYRASQEGPPTPPKDDDGVKRSSLDKALPAPPVEQSPVRQKMGPRSWY